MKKEELEGLEEAVKSGLWLKISIPKNYIRKVDIYSREGKDVQKESEVMAETLGVALARASLHVRKQDDALKWSRNITYGYAHPNSNLDYLLLHGFYLSVGAEEENYVLRVWHREQDERRNQEIYSTAKPISSSLLSVLQHAELSWARYLVESLSQRQDFIDIKSRNEFLKH